MDEPVMTITSRYAFVYQSGDLFSIVGSDGKREWLVCLSQAGDTITIRKALWRDHVRVWLKALVSPRAWQRRWWRVWDAVLDVMGELD